MVVFQGIMKDEPLDTRYSSLEPPGTISLFECAGPLPQNLLMMDPLRNIHTTSVLIATRGLLLQIQFARNYVSPRWGVDK